MPHTVNEIESYLLSHVFSVNMVDIYVKCKSAKYRFIHTDYLFTNEDRDYFVMLASGWSAVIRKSWRIFIVRKGYEPRSFWNAFIKVFIFSQSVLFDDTWKKIFKEYEKDLLSMVRKTSNPKFIEKMFTGINWKQLHYELNKNYEEVR